MSHIDTQDKMKATVRKMDEEPFMHTDTPCSFLPESPDGYVNSCKTNHGKYFAQSKYYYYLCPPKKEDWQSDRMRWTRNPVYRFLVSGV